jgi:hypothetical protein
MPSVLGFLCLCGVGNALVEKSFLYQEVGKWPAIIYHLEVRT